MKTILTLLMVVVVMCMSTASFAQNTYIKSVDEAKGISLKVTELFKTGKIGDAFKELKLYWPLPENEIDGLEEKTIKQLNLVAERFGKSEGIIKVNESMIKDIAMRETYFVRYRYTSLRLIFTYYKNDSGWLINGFKWDDSFTEEFK